MASEWLTPPEGAAQAARPNGMQAVQANVINLVFHSGLGPLPRVLSSLFRIIGLEGAWETTFDQAHRPRFPRTSRKVERFGPGATGLGSAARQNQPESDPSASYERGGMVASPCY